MVSARMLIIGAGVNGSVCAVDLYNAGNDVTVLARGKRYEEVRDEGIVIEDPFKNKRRVAKVPVINHLDPDDLYDFVLVVVRKNQVADLLTVLAHNRSPNVVFMGNNLSGPGDFTSVLGKHRVMIGAVYAAGKRDGSIIRAITVKWFGVPLGEVDGKITPRLKRLVGIFRQAGIKARTSTEIVDFQKTHAAVVALLAKLIIKHGCDTSALARSTEDLRLFLHARREAHQVLRALGHRIIPWSEVVFGLVPDCLQVAALRALLNSKLGKVGAGWHCSQAPDEMRQLGLEFQALVDQTSLPAPAVRKVLGDC
ncbi:MAG TPA: 2-dehydropantoate 2-reductase N-terminal domain-containing protein [Gemmataceae bacterium]|nr:2-dehydropantoate 2-reductase N-terminal domain-containing protein [Gemmataceae bacterium]